jgi:hypothetical protein
VKIPTFISAVRLRGPALLPPERLERLNRTHRRRIDDVIEEAFKHACMNGDLETASDLADVLERKLARWLQARGTDNRNGSAQLQAMRNELARRCAPPRPNEGA